MKKGLFFTGFFMYLMVTTVLNLGAQTYTVVKDVESLKKKLKATSESIHTIQAEFTQTKKMSILQDEVVSKGKFYFQEKDQIRWEIITPDPYIVVINGYKMTVQNKSKTKTYDTKAHKMFGRINETMMATIKGSFGEQNSGYKEEYMESKDFYQLKLTPTENEGKKFLSVIEIYFDKTTYDVSSLKMVEKEGDFTEIKFFNKVLNGTIPASTFQLSK